MYLSLNRTLIHSSSVCLYPHLSFDIFSLINHSTASFIYSFYLFNSIITIPNWNCTYNWFYSQGIRRATWAWPWANCTATISPKRPSPGSRRWTSPSRTCASWSRCWSSGSRMQTLTITTVNRLVALSFYLSPSLSLSFSLSPSLSTYRVI